MNFSGIKELFLQDKKAKINLNEGKYILSILAERYEEYLKSRKTDLENEADKLSKDKELIKNINERKEIEAKLREIDKEKKRDR